METDIVNLKNLNGINVLTLQEEFEIDIDDIIEMYSNFKDEFQKNIELLNLPSDSKEFKNFIHKIKGSSGNLRIEFVFELSKKIYTSDFNEEDVTQLKAELNRVFLLIEKEIISLNQNKTISISKVELDEMILTTIEKLKNYNIIKDRDIEKLLYNLQEYNCIDLETVENLKEYFLLMEYEKIINVLKNIKE